MKRLLKYISLSLLFVFILLAGLATYSFFVSYMDFGLFFSGQSCKAPCWHNLTPGQSTSEDVDHFLDSLSETTWPTRDIRTPISECKSILVIDQFHDASVSLFVENDRLTFIQSSHTYIANLGQIVDRFGPPEYAEATLAVGPEGRGYTLEVYYPRQGLSFQILPSIKDVGLIKKEMEVYTAEYYQPGDLLSYLTDKYSCDMGQENAKAFAQNTIKYLIQTWPGFGKVNVILRKT